MHTQQKHTLLSEHFMPPYGLCLVFILCFIVILIPSVSLCTSSVRKKLHSGLWTPQLAAPLEKPPVLFGVVAAPQQITTQWIFFSPPFFVFV